MMMGMSSNHVSEELNSVETMIYNPTTWIRSLFQKNLIVWKPAGERATPVPNDAVSEELNSVETLLLLYLCDTHHQGFRRT